MLARNLEAGLGLAESLDSAASVTADPEVHARAAAAVAAVAAGEGLAAAIVSARLVAPDDRVVLVTGEQAGARVAGLDALADRYGEQLDRGLAVALRAVGALLTVAVLAHVAWQVYSGLQQTLGGAAGPLQDALEQLQREMPRELRGYPLGR
jgi:type II secretory pathway component PulF